MQLIDCMRVITNNNIIFLLSSVLPDFYKLIIKKQKNKYSPIYAFSIFRVHSIQYILISLVKQKLPDQLKLD